MIYKGGIICRQEETHTITPEPENGQGLRANGKREEVVEEGKAIVVHQ